MKKRVESCCIVPDGIVDEPTYALLVSEVANTMLGVFVQYGRKWKMLN